MKPETGDRVRFVLPLYDNQTLLRILRNPPYRHVKNAPPSGRAFGPSQLYCQSVFQHLTALLTSIAEL